jgi:hypothetical protein
MITTAVRTSNPTYLYLLIFTGLEFAGAVVNVSGFITLKVDTDLGKLIVCKSPSVTYVKSVGKNSKFRTAITSVTVDI